MFTNKCIVCNQDTFGECNNVPVCYFDYKSGRAKIYLYQKDKTMIPTEYTFRLVDGYTGEVLRDVGDTFNPVDIPENARIVMCDDYDMIFVHQTTFNFCCCKSCMNNKQYAEHCL